MKLRNCLGLCSILTLISYQSATAQASENLYQYKQLDGSNSELHGRGGNVLQPSPGPDKSGAVIQVGDNTSQRVPFDGGLTLFLAAGVGIAAKKKFDKRKKATIS